LHPRGPYGHTLPGLAEETVAGIQGAIVLARALDDPSAFGRIVAKVQARLTAP